jgi:hypothetical protein
VMSVEISGVLLLKNQSLWTASRNFGMTTQRDSLKLRSAVFCISLFPMFNVLCFLLNVISFFALSKNAC